MLRRASPTVTTLTRPDPQERKGGESATNVGAQLIGIQPYRREPAPSYDKEGNGELRAADEREGHR